MTLALKKRLPEMEIVVLSNVPYQKFPLYRTIPRKDPLAILKELFTTDLFISGGGGLIQDVTGVSTIDYYMGLVLMARLAGRKVMFYAQGVGPVNTEKGKKHTRFVANRVDFITVRDEESKQLFHHMGVSKPPVVVTGDPVVALEPAPGERVEAILKEEHIGQEKAFKVGISIRPWQTSCDFLTAMAGAADRLIEACGAEIILIPFQKSQDEKPCREVASLMKRKSVLLQGSYSPEELQGVMGKMDMIIGMRLHSLIFGATQAIPMIGIAYDPKVRIFSQSIGIPCLLLDELTEEGITKIFDEVYKGRDELKETIQKKVAHLRENALKTADIACDIINGKPVGTMEEAS